MSSETGEQINSTLMIAFIKSVTNVLAKTSGLECSPNKPCVKNDNTPRYDISSIVEFSGGVIGSVVVSFPKPTAEAITEAFVGRPYPNTDDDTLDAIAELTNIIAGNAKRDFGVMATSTIPRVVMDTAGPGGVSVTSDPHAIPSTDDGPCVAIPWNSGAGEFEVNIHIAAANGAATKPSPGF